MLAKITFVLVSSLISLGLVTAALTAKVLPQPAAKQRLAVRGSPYFLAGVNYPWKSYQDFGTGGWGHYGVSNPITYAEVDTDFENMAAQGVRVVKWRIFNDGRYSPELDSRGFVTGLDELFFADIDAALEIARKHDMYLIFTLFASGLWTTDCVSGAGVRFGGYAETIVNPAKRASLVRKAVVPLLQHLGRNDRVLAYEIIAEPEWGVDKLHTEKDYRKTIPLAAVRALVADVAKSVHSYTNARATVESNRSSNMRHWRGLGLDYYSFSWYDWVEPWEPLDTPAQKLNLDKPAVIGEFPVAGSEYYSPDQVLDVAYQQGYGGAFAWSFGSGDRFSQWWDIRTGYSRWVADHWGEVNLSGNGPAPGANPPIKPQPYGYFVPAFAVSGNSATIDVGLEVREGGSFITKLYLFDLQNNPTGHEQEVQATFPKNGQRNVRVRFDGLEEEQLYKLNIALFDQSWNLKKWFDGIAFFAVKDGRLQFPEPSQEALENPCGG